MQPFIQELLFGGDNVQSSRRGLRNWQRQQQQQQAMGACDFDDDWDQQDMACAYTGMGNPYASGMGNPYARSMNRYQRRMQQQNVFGGMGGMGGMGGLGSYQQQQWRLAQQQTRPNTTWASALCQSAQQYDDEDCFDDDDDMNVAGGRYGNRFAGHCDDDDMVGGGFGSHMGGFGRRWARGGSGSKLALMKIAKRNIVCDLVEDREKDAFQHDVTKHLILNRRYNRNRVGIIQCLINGENIPRNALVQLLAEDFVLDRVSDNMVLRLCKDKLLNRDADHIIYDLSNGIPHLPHPGQEMSARKTAAQQQFVARVVKTILNPNFAKRVVNSGAVLKMLQNVDCDYEDNMGMF